MKKISVVIPTGEKVEADLVRFFEAYGKKYLVYTLNEKDEQGFVKLYVARVEETSDATGTQHVLIGEFIEDDNEWKSVKDEFKKIIGENNDSGSTSVNDLNPANLANINVRGQRVIKLMESYVNLLGANQKQFSAETPAMNTAPQSAPSMNFDYQAPSAAFPEPPIYQAPSAPAVNPAPQSAPSMNFDYQAPSAAFPEPPIYQAPSAPAVNPAPQSAPAMDFGVPTPSTPNFDYQAPSVPFPEPPVYQAPSAPASGNNYEAMYNDLKAKFDRCNAELEKVTNENIELRIKIDDIREILNEN